jgi:dienelactone hydrolase
VTDRVYQDPVWKHRKNRHDTQDPNFDYEAWKKKHTAFADEAVPRWTKAVREGYGGVSTKYACVGYCFGAPYVCDELAGNLVTVGAFAHPAFLKEHHFTNLKSKISSARPCLSSSFADRKVPLLEPLFLSCSEIDHTFDVPSRRKALDIMQKGQKIFHYQLFSGVEHGFALRGDPEDAYQRRRFMGPGR